MKEMKKLSILFLTIVFSAILVPSKVFGAPAIMKGYSSGLGIRVNENSNYIVLYQCTENATGPSAEISNTWSSGNSSASYNYATNTLTLSNVNIYNIYSWNMGQDFKISVVGSNTVNYIKADGANVDNTNGVYNQVYGNSITLMGSGSLMTTQIYIDAATTNSSINLQGSLSIQLKQDGSFPVLAVEGTSNSSSSSAINVGLADHNFTGHFSNSYHNMYDHQYSGQQDPLMVYGPEHEARKLKMSSAAIALSATSYTYDGTEKKPSVTVRYGDKVLINGVDYTVSYANNINSGTATVTITGIGTYTGTQQAAFSIKQASVVFKNTLKEVKQSKVSKKKQAWSIIQKSGGGKVTYKVTKGKKKYITVSKAGKLTVKKGAPKGVYKISVTVAQKGNYKKTKKTITVLVN